MSVMRRPLLHIVAAIVAIVLGIAPTAVFAADGSFIGPLSHKSVVASTVPGNGDQNPYGVVVIPATVGNLTQGNVLISNFNNKGNAQGTGTTIVEIAPNGSRRLFARINPATLPGSCPGGVGLTGALVVLQRGWVIVGSLPTSDGTSATAKAGCLIVLNSNGKVVETLAGAGINGPWGMTVLDQGATALLFESNVLNGTVAGNGTTVNRGTILRIGLNVPTQGHGIPGKTLTTTIGSGFSERTDPAALVIGPQGLGLAGNTLFIADSLDNRIAAISNATMRSTSDLAGSTVTASGFVNGPIGLTIAPNGDILTTNGTNGLLVETTKAGAQIAHKLVDNTGTPPGNGCLFDLAITPGGTGVYYADDCSNTLNLLH
jgi:hypothetical protein